MGLNRSRAGASSMLPVDKAEDCDLDQWFPDSSHGLAGIRSG